MNNDFYIDEIEVAVASNTAFGLLNFLAASLGMYSSLMTQVVEESIRDDKVNEQILEIINNANTYNEELIKLADKLQGELIAKELVEVEDCNKFEFPDDPNLDAIPVFGGYEFGGF